MNELVRNSSYSQKLKAYLDSGTTEATIAKILLMVVATASIPALLVVAGTIGNAIQIFGSSKYGKNYSKQQIRTAFSSLRRQKYIEYISEKNGQIKVRLTNKGTTKVKTFAIESLHIEKPKTWDGKWRLVIFDFPIRFAKVRNAFRFRLKALGFVQFQKSVWMYPYPCDDEILFVADYFKVGKYVEVLEVSNFSNDAKLKKHFHL